MLELGDAPGDVMTFCEVRVGGEWALTIEGITSGEEDSLYQILWENFGSHVEFEIAPQGNLVASADAPHYTGTVVFDELPPLNLTSNEVVSFSVTLQVRNTGLDVATGLFYGIQKVIAA